MKKVNGITKAITPSNTKPMVIALIGLCVLSAIFYVYAINQTVRNVVRLQSAQSDLSHLTATLSDKEFQYINQKNSITIEKATAMGFAQAEPTKFIARKTAVALAHITDNTR